jgi:tetratricopeptide (TPR) repeat protein
LLGGALAIFLVGIVIAIGALSSRGILPGGELSVEKKLDRSIAAGHLFGPAPDNAHDLYVQLKNNGASETTLKSYRERLVPLLTTRPLQMISNLMTPGSEDPPVSDWQAAIRPLQWAAELKPGDLVLSSRVIYCEGRVAYLLKQEEEALDAWRRAAEADKSWPLPSNGMGLIYFSRKNYSTARAHYLEAVRRDPNWAYPYNNLGTAFHYDKNDSSAKSYYRKAIELVPHWARPHAWLGEIAMKEREFGTAVAEYEAVLDQNATGTTNMDLDKIRSKLEEARVQMNASGY